MVIQAKKKSYEKWIKFIEKKRDQNAKKIHSIQHQATTFKHKT
jgi:hypothetical protein